jgi:exopolysaccharide biosynthesis protein
LGWLVRHGSSYLSRSLENSTFVLEKAPRTALGIFTNGSMLLYQVDGEEVGPLGSLLSRHPTRRG